MSKGTRLTDFPFVTSRLEEIGEEAPSLDEKMELVGSLCGSHPGLREALDRYLLGRVDALRQGLEESTARTHELGRLLEKLTEPPWHPALYLGAVGRGERPAALVQLGDSRRVVGLGEDLDPATITVGEELLLGHELNVALSKAEMTVTSGLRMTFLF